VTIRPCRGTGSVGAPARRLPECGADAAEVSGRFRDLSRGWVVRWRDAVWCYVGTVFRGVKRRTEMSGKRDVSDYREPVPERERCALCSAPVAGPAPARGAADDG